MLKFCQIYLVLPEVYWYLPRTDLNAKPTQAVTILKAILE
jgi:hypothetical protein